MELTYDGKARALYIRFAEGVQARTQTINEGLLADMDGEGNLLGLEVLDAPNHPIFGQLLPRANGHLRRFEAAY